MTSRCQTCGRFKRRPGRLCARCYMREYRLDPAVRARHRRAVKLYQRLNPDDRRRWVSTSKAIAKVRAAAGGMPPPAGEARRIMLELLALADQVTTWAEVRGQPRATKSGDGGQPG